MTGRWFDSSPRTQNLKRGEVEVIRRLLVVLSLSASLLVGTCFAWDAESFIGNDYGMYAIGETPMMMANSASLYAAESDDSDIASLSISDFYSNFPSINFGLYQTLVGSYGSIFRVVAAEDVSIASAGGPAFGAAYGRILEGNVTVPSAPRSYTAGSVFGFGVGAIKDSGSAPSVWTDGYFDYQLPISSLGDFYSLEFNSSLYLMFYRIPLTHSGVPYRLDVLINGELYRSLSPIASSGDSRLAYFDLTSVRYDSAVAISSVVLRIYGTFGNPVDLNDGIGNTVSFPSDEGESYLLRFWVGVDSADQADSFMTVYTGSPEIGTIIDNAQSTIDEMDGIETDWGQKMNQYVSQLSISDFAFPSDLQSAGALVSGIFQDIWYAFGDYKILFVFPLTLALCLVLTGRIARAYASGAFNRGKGDDD